MRKHKWLNKRKLENSAVSEIIGTIMLLMISVTLFTAIYASVLTVDVAEAPPSVNLVGIIDDNMLIVDHIGGDSLELDTLIILGAPGGASTDFEVQQNLSSDSIDDGFWDIGEKMEYDLECFTDFNRFDPLDLTVVDPKSNSVIMMGTLQEEKFADVTIYFDSETDINPGWDQFELNVITENKGPAGADDIVTKVIIPEGLSYIGSSGGTYDKSTGLWDVGSLSANTETTLTFNLQANTEVKPEVTQLAFLIDGSTAISSENWDEITTHISDAIGADGGIPVTGNNVQLTVVTYGNGDVWDDALEPFTDTVVAPTFLTEGNYEEIANAITSFQQPGGTHRPMAHGFRRLTNLLCGLQLSTSLYEASLTHQSSYRQVIVLITGGHPNVAYPVPTLTSVMCKEQNAWSSAVKERNRMIKCLGMTLDQDEIDVMAILDPTGLATNIKWLQTRIAYPQPITISDVANPPENIGWVMQITSENAEQGIFKAIESLFDISFASRLITAEIISTKYFDPDKTNDLASIVIFPG